MLRISAGELCRARTFINYSHVSEGVEEHSFNDWVSSQRRRRSVDLMAVMSVGLLTIAKTPRWLVDARQFLCTTWLLKASVASPVDLMQIIVG